MSDAASVSEGEADVARTLGGMKEDALRSLLYLTVAGTVTWYLCDRIQTPMNSAPDWGLFILPVLLLEGLTHFLLAEHRRSAAWVFLLGGIALIDTGIVIFDCPQGMFLFAIMALASVVVSGPTMGLVVAALGSGTAYAATQAMPSVMGESGQVLTVALSSFITVGVSWVLSHNFALAVR